MTETSETYLQKLIEEEKVIKSALKLVKSRFLQLQVEHMGLKIAQRNLLLKGNNASSAETISPILNELSGQKVLNTDKQLSSVNEVAEVPVPDNEELDFRKGVESVSESCATDGDLGKIFSEKELDDPVVMNQMELDLNTCLGSVTDNHFVNETSLKGFLEPDFDDNSML